MQMRTWTVYFSQLSTRISFTDSATWHHHFWSDCCQRWKLSRQTGWHL